MKSLLLMIPIFIALVVSCSAPKQKSPQELEKEYQIAVAEFLQAVVPELQQLAKMMAAAKTRDATLTEIRLKLKKTQDTVGLAFTMYDGIKIPPKFQPTDAGLRSFYAQFDKGVDETFLYWEDKDTKHIKDGTWLIESSMKTLTNTIDSLNKIK